MNKSITRGTGLSHQAKVGAGASLLAAAISACYTPTVVAQSKGNDLMLEEIVVTVRRRVEMEQDVPISLEVMDSDDLRAQNIAELDDLGRKIPAVSMTMNSSSNQPIITIRGQRPTDTTLSLDQAVPIYFNEVVMTPSIGTNLAMYDLQSVQVLKGPQGTLFGRNSTGGAFLITPNRPGLEVGGYAELEVGNYNQVKFQGAVDLPASDDIQFRIATQKTSRDGYQDNVADNALKGEEFWDEDSQGIRITMNANIGDVNNITTIGFDENEMASRMPKMTEYMPLSLGGLTNAIFNRTGDVDASVARLRNSDATDIETDVNGYEEVENTFFSNITEFDLTDDLTFKSVIGYRKAELDSAVDADGTALSMLGPRTSTTFEVTANPSAAQTTESEQYSIELQLVGDALDGSLEWIAGAYWYEMDAETVQEQQIVGPNVRPNSLQALGLYELVQSQPSGDVNNQATGLFAEGTYLFNDEYSVTLGLRQSWDEREVTVRNQVQAPDPFLFSVTGIPLAAAGDPLICGVQDEDGNTLPNDDCSRTVSEDYSKPTGRLSLNYTPTDGMLLYGSFSTGYRAGGINLRGTDNVSLTPFDEEEVTTIEIGHKADWGMAGYGPIKTNLAIYTQDYQNIQKTQSVANGSTFVTTTVNAGEATIEGIEFDITWLVTENLTLYAAYAHTDAGYDEWDLFQRTIGGDTILLDASTNDFEWLPKNTLAASISYLLPVDPALGDMTLSANVYWQDEMNSYGTPDNWDDLGLDGELLERAYNTLEIDAYDIWGLRFDWRNAMGSDFDIAAYVDNLTDEEYEVGGFNQLTSLGLATLFYGPPRTFGLSARYNF